MKMVNLNMKRTFQKFQTRGRFYVAPSENIPGGWMVVDCIDGTLVDFDKRSWAEGAAQFARAYVSKWGDIDFGSFPWDLNSPLHYELWENREWNRPWINEEEL